MQQAFEHEALDLQFDAIFAAQESLPWWPWVGSQFHASPQRTMLLGESVYDWSPSNETCKQRYAHVLSLIHI